MNHSLGAVAMDKLFISTDIHSLKLQCQCHNYSFQWLHTITDTKVMTVLFVALQQKNFRKPTGY